ncbi:MAG TPA: Uma2 family endonuclease [Candidatus Limnocylindrales bacterium]|nr:Uma2 family endonuclease [Candidatus Limnocylindrales bacterium]
MDTAFRSDGKFTQAEFCEWLAERPSHDHNRYELIGRHIVMTPPAGYPHSPIAATIVSAIHVHVERLGSGLVNDSSAGFELPTGETVEPDASYLSERTLVSAPEPEIGKFYRIVPDLIVEILSPATAKRDRTEKKQIYEKNGVGEYWIVDPNRRQVIVYRLAGNDYANAIHVVNGNVEASVLPGLSIPLSKIFASLDRKR